jgi:NodT family efflux transporter outer membrane factor (OMF) lipoprotein
VLRPGTRHYAAASAAFTAALLAGCVTPRAAPEEHVLTGAAVGLRGPVAAPAIDWWRGLDDPQLDRIMADALAASPTLEVALARLRLAGSGVEASHAGLLPQVGIDAQEQLSRLSGSAAVPPPYAGTGRWVGSTQASLSWTLDFAGRQRALISQATHSADAAALDAAAARLALTGAVAEAYVGLARAEQQTRIAGAFVRSRQASLALARVRSRNDLSSDFDVRAAETLLAEAQKALDKAKGQRALMIHALAALAGRGADAYAGLAPPTLSLDAALPLPASLPANLLDRRPDILAARARIEAAGAGRKAARADFYPSVDLRAFLGVSAIGLAPLLTGKALAYGGGPAVRLPVFEGGRLRAQYKAATAEVDAATAAYNGLILSAVHEAADALSGIETAAAQAADQREVLDGLAETVRLDEVRVRSGLGAQLDILASGDRLLQARQAQADLDAEGLTRRIQLLVAVGGDFNPDTPSNSKARS